MVDAAQGGMDGRQLSVERVCQAPHGLLHSPIWPNSALTVPSLTLTRLIRTTLKVGPDLFEDSFHSGRWWWKGETQRGESSNLNPT